MNRRFVRGLRERTVSTVAIAALAAWTLSQDWRYICLYAALQGAYTALKCLAVYKIGDDGTPGWLRDAS